MSRSRRYQVLAATVLVALVGITLLPARSAGKGEEVMRVCDQNKPGFNHDVDIEGDGFSSGDYSVFADKLLDSRTGRKAGHLNGQLMVIRHVGNRDAVVRGDVLLFFPIGKLSLTFASRFSDFQKGISFPVTGGTGHFQHATGSVRIKTGSCDGKPGLKLRIETKH